MSTEEKELYFSIMEEIYLKGTTSSDISVESLLSDLRKKLIPVMMKEVPLEETRSV
jgi:hypothetical protein